MIDVPQPTDDIISRRAWMALSVSTVVVFLVVINITTVSIAFPSIRRAYDVSDAGLSWVISSYNVAVGTFLLVTGRLADSLGRRRVYLPGVAIFGLGSMLCAVAPGLGWLIGARVVQGIGGSITMAAGFAVMLPEFPATRRATAIGISGAAGSLGAVVGPFLGSILIDAFGWRSVFWMNVPLCVLVLLLGPRYLSESRDPEATGRIDLGGIALGTSSVLLAMLAIVQSEAWGLGDVRIVVMVVVALALVPWLIRRSRVHPTPLIDLELFRFRSFTSANISVVFYGLAFTSGALVTSVFLQDVWELPIRDVGVAFVFAPLLAAAVSPITGRWADRIGHRWLLGAGCTSSGVAYLLYIVLLDETVALWSRYVPISLFLGLGIGLTVATWSSAGIADVPQSRFGIAGATFNTLRSAAYALGVAIVITIVATAGDEPTLVGVERAYAFIALSYFAAAVTVMVTFPAGSARDRARTEPR